MSLVTGFLGEKVPISGDGVKASSQRLARASVDPTLRALSQRTRLDGGGATGRRGRNPNRQERAPAPPPIDYGQQELPAPLEDLVDTDELVAASSDGELDEELMEGLIAFFDEAHDALEPDVPANDANALAAIGEAQTPDGRGGSPNDRAAGS